MVEKDLLSLCLKSCEKLEYEKTAIECDLFEEFRKTAFRIIQSAEMEISPQGSTIKRYLWKLIRRLSESPFAWKNTLSEVMGYQTDEFLKSIEYYLGNEVLVHANKLNDLWGKMVSLTGAQNPLAKYIFEEIELLRDEVIDFRILAIGPYRPDYLPFLEQLELDGADLFCTVNTLKKSQPFSTLITCGPFRDNDPVFTSPRYNRIVNVRWSVDKDISGFPEYLSEEVFEDTDSMFPSDFPCRVFQTEYLSKVDLQYQPEVEFGDDWSFDAFEEVYIKRRKRYRGYSAGNFTDSITFNPEADNKRQASSHSFSKLVFFDGSYVIFPFDQQNKPPFLFSIDPETDFEIKKRRPYDSTSQPVDEVDKLQPGMLVIVEPDASEALAGSAFKESKKEPLHLRYWKEVVKEGIENLMTNGISIKNAMQRLKIDPYYENIEGAVKRWSKFRPGRIDSPYDLKTFKILLTEFVQYPEWEKAWLEILSLRGASISRGLIANSTIDQYLVKSVEKNSQTVLDNPKTILNVKGFDAEVIVIEVADMISLSEEDIEGLNINKYYQTDDSLLGE
ncbi:MAG: hypothetical protein CME31_22470 [Gimesia sp.]|uniref:Uncharacterized protein n=1 Tax=Gimesia maris TaxID=122 RepID=A0A3D3REL7_9PLAN|nr:hypothetical protein [Gimesia sp.]HCO27056.1 hypothetical protein [Gimesia maris]|tara:strand:+ start:5604 stop:7286 length:1683 start_codon:yes stop_codon:yes gene_type:complete